MIAQLKRKSIYIIAGIVISLGLLNSCKDDQVFTGDAQLRFSSDTLRFDTVFTELGSATRSIKIFNDQDQNVLLKSVEIAGGSSSFFRINVDGKGGGVVSDVRIPPNDSIYVFVETTIDPDNPLSVSPFIIEDQLRITTDSGEEFVHLEAWGQNANYIPLSRKKGGASRLSCNFGEEIWDDPKPYVIYGILIIDTCKLVLPAGTRIYVHGGIVNDPVQGVYNDGIIAVGANGSIDARGTATDSIVIQGDRLEAPFAEIAGQWGGIIFTQESTDNNISHVTVKNSIIGMRADSMANVSIDHSQFYNTIGAGLIGIHANLNVSNSLFHTNGGHAVQCSYGGNYNFEYCTITSYENNIEALRMDNYFCREPLCFGQIDLYPLSAQFTNCILSGSQKDELFFDDLTDGTPGFFDYQFDHSIVRVDTLLQTVQFADFFDNAINSININTSDSDTLFVNAGSRNFKLDTLSIAERMAMPINGIVDDLVGSSRDNQEPDIGCFEYLY